MEPENRKRLKKNYCLLVDNLQFNEIQDLLFQENILDDEEVETIEGKATKKSRIRELLKILKGKQGVFEKFCQVLRNCEAGYSYIADELKNTEIVDDDEDLVDGNDQSYKEKVDQLMTQVWDQTQIMSDLKKQHHMEVTELQRRLSAASQLQSPESHRPVEKDVVGTRFVEKYVAEFMQMPSNDRFSPTDWINHFSQRSVDDIACHLGIDIMHYCLRDAGYDVKLNPADMYTSVMREMVKEALEKYGKDLENCVLELHTEELNGYFAIESLADELFEDDKEVNWGRIVAWYAFWAKCVISFPKLHIAQLNEFINLYGKFIGFYLARRLQSWIKMQGGWASFVKWQANGRKIQRQRSAVINIAYVVQILLKHFPFQP